MKETLKVIHLPPGSWPITWGYGARWGLRVVLPICLNHCGTTGPASHRLGGPQCARWPRLLQTPLLFWAPLQASSFLGQSVNRPEEEYANSEIQEAHWALCLFLSREMGQRHRPVTHC